MGCSPSKCAQSEKKRRKCLVFKHLNQAAIVPNAVDVPFRLANRIFYDNT